MAAAASDTVIVTAQGALSADGRASAHQLTGGSRLGGKLHVETLNDDFTVIDVVSQFGKGEVAVRIPPKTILSVISR